MRGERGRWHISGKDNQIRKRDEGTEGNEYSKGMAQYGDQY